MIVPVQPQFDSIPSNLGGGWKPEQVGTQNKRLGLVVGEAGELMSIEYKKLCTKQQAEEVQRLWIESDTGLNPVSVEGRYMWFRSIPKITAKRKDLYSVKFFFLPADPHSDDVRLI